MWRMFVSFATTYSNVWARAPLLPDAAYTARPLCSAGSRRRALRARLKLTVAYVSRSRSLASLLGPQS